MKNRFFSALVVLGAFLGAGFPALAQQLTFSSTNLTTGSGSVGMVPVDVNGDGYMDLVCANFGFHDCVYFGNSPGTGTTLSVFTNDGKGNLTLNSSPTVGLSPVVVAAADVNGDGSPDLISANVGDSTVTVLTNDGKGGFALSGTYTVGAGPSFVAAADVNGDGSVDLITANFQANTLTVLTNNGHGTFKLSATISVGSEPNCVAAADFNGDGKMDLVCASIGDSTLLTLTNNGHGVFSPAGTNTVATGLIFVVATDVDHDGTVDLVTAGGSTLNVFTNNGRGVFTLKSSPASADSGAVATADFNGLGNVDLVCPNNGGVPSQATVLTNDGHGNFTVNTVVPVGAPGLDTYPNFVTAADFTGDGNADAAVSCFYDPGNITVLTQTNVASRPIVTITNPANDSLIPATDSFAINATVTPATNIAAVLYYVGTTILASSTNAPFTVQIPAGTIPAGTHALQAVAINSANHDGWSAEIQINVTSSQVVAPPVVKITAPATGASFTTTEGIAVTTSDSSSVTEVQLHVDGQVYATTTGAPFGFEIPAGALSPGSHTLQAVAFNSENASASSAVVNIVVNEAVTALSFSNATLAVGSGPSFVLPVDLTGGGLPSLVTPDYGFAENGCIGSYNGADGSNITVWINNGQGVFSSDYSILVGDPALGPINQPEPECVAAADFNSDGKVEFVSANFYYNTLNILTNNGDGALSLGTNVGDTARGPVFVTTADVNGDGKPDLIVANDYDSEISVLTNAGGLKFASSAILPVAYGASWIAVADFNGDGILDMACASHGSDCGDGDTLTVFLGDGHGGFTTNATITVGGGPECVVAADINGDGKIDLITANQTGNSLTVLTNDGLGNFSLKATIPIEGPTCLVATNISASGRIDLACANNGTGADGKVTVLLNDGLGNFAVSTVMTVGKLGLNSYYPNRIAAADFNGDGKMDLVAANYGAGSLSVLTQISSQKLPVVTITTPTNGESFPTNQSFVVQATTSSSVSEVEFFVDGQLAGQAAGAPYSFPIAAGSLPPGGHTVQAVALTSQNFSASSPVINFTLNTPGTSLIDFDALNTSAGAVGGTLLADYLAGYGVTLTDVTAGTALEAVNTNSLTASIQVDVPSSPNFFTQGGLDQPVSFTLVFATNLQSFGFTRVGLSAQSGLVSHPQWTATAFDGNGNELGSVTEALILSSTNVPERFFALTGNGIASVRFDSDSRQTAAFSAVLLDNLVLNYNPTASLLAVALSVVTPPTNDIVAPATITLRAAVADLVSSSYSVSFFAGPALLGTVSAAPYRLVWTSVLPGNYDLQALAVDASGLAVESPVVPITVQTEPSSTVVDFDALNASKGPVEGTLLKNYLAGFGISVASLSPATELAVESQHYIAGGAAVLAASPSNLLTQIGSNGPVQFTLRFTPLLSQFGFTRPELLANPFVSHPAWQVTALDGAGVVVDQVAEGQIDSVTNVGAREFALNASTGPGIAEVVFSSEGTGLTTFNAMLADNFVLTTNKSGFPPAVAITQPVAGQVLAAPPALTVTAAASDPSGIAEVGFYADGSLIGTATSSPYSATWQNPPIGNHPLKAIALNGLGLTWTAPIVHIVIQPSAYQFGISSQPASQTIAAGASVTFSVVTTGTNGVGYQWSFDGAPISGATSGTYVLKPPIQDANAGTYTVAATAGGTTLVSDPAVLTVVDPPTFTTQPQGKTVAAGTDVIMTAAAAGTGPFTWRWLLNGSTIPGATNRDYQVAAAQPHQSGNYQVVVANMAASALSAMASLIVETPIAIPETNDDFANRAGINPLLGPVSDSNQLATLEPGEPLPDGLPGGKSIWFTWQAAFTGTISLTTEGSDFDTLLAVYTGTKLTALKPVAADHDSGGFLTSLVTFNVTEGTDYQIDVDGYQGAYGRVVLGLPPGTGYRILSPTSGDSVPVIVREPASKTVAPNASATLSVEASSPTKMSYQWYFEGAPVAGATSSELVISHVQPGSVGMYDVLVDNAAGSAQSEPATLEIGVNQGGAVTSAENEFVDATAGASPKELAYVLHPVATGGDTRGFSVAQTFSTVGATREPDEPAPCGQIGGAALWFVYTAPAAGMMQIDTEGSSFNTLLGVYTGPGTSLSTLEEVGCGYTTNFATDGQPTVILPDVAKGTAFYILVDGYQGATGVAHLDIGLGQPLTFRSLPASQVVTAGSTATFDVTAVGSTPFSYQWQLNGVNVPGATTATCKITDAQERAEGNYTVIVSNVIGAVTSSPPAVLTVQYAPDIVSGPSSVTVKVGQPAKFIVTALGVNVKTNPFVCQWYFDGAPLAKATSLSLSIPVARLTNSGTYGIVITNTYGAVTSTPATLTVVSPTPAQRMSLAGLLPAAAGTYSGLFYPSDGATEASSGFLTATVAAKGAGAFSANLLLDGGSYPFTGKFDPYGDAQSIVPRTGKASVTVSLRLDLDPPDGQLTGVISDADWSSILQAGRALFNAATNPAPVSAGPFALVIPSGAGAPVGYLTLTNVAGGTALVTGTLADGARIVRATPMVKSAAIPLYAPLYCGKGLFLGWITFTNSAGQTNFDGAFWIKPGSTNVTGVQIVK